MNKILIDNETKETKFVIDKESTITMNYLNTEKNIEITLNDNINLKVIDTSNNTKNKITYNIGENSKVEINKLSKDCSDKVTVNINKENSNIKFYSSIINYEDNTYHQDINHYNRSSKSKIVNHCININDNNFKFIVNGTIKNNAENTIFKQDNKIININNGNSQILPNLIVDNDEIEASHSAYIGTFDENIIFYLMTRGIPKKDCINLLIKSFLLTDMNLEEEQERFNEIIENIKI